MMPLYANNISLKITLIGYCDKGETIIFCIMADNSPFFCGVIDSYYTSNENYLLKELKKMGISYLDLIVWSHPHEDHSAGLEYMIPYINQDTYICLSSKCYQYSDFWRNANPVFFGFCEDEKKKPQSPRNIKILETSSCMQIPHPKIKKIHALSSDVKYDFILYAFSPDSINLGRFDYRNSIDINQFSVGLVLQLGEVTVVFASDVPNTVFDNMGDNPLPEHIDYLKVPHHGSETSTHILDHVAWNIGTSCSTTFSRYSIPNQSTRELYESKSNHFYLTGRCGATHDIGVIETTIDVTNALEVKTELIGEALVSFDY